MTLLFACSPGQAIPTATATSTPQPTSTSIPSLLPYQRYGETLRDVTYCTSENLPQKMDVYFPQAGGPWPVLAYVHGGAWMSTSASKKSTPVREVALPFLSSRM
ncbi:MAG TPA: hypothetical protein VLE49_05665 [Anaerolineales bacterium]|nr:hypothetical protein [Anaerolineales bacterium]